MRWVVLIIRSSTRTEHPPQYRLGPHAPQLAGPLAPQVVRFETVTGAEAAARERLRAGPGTTWRAIPDVEAT